LFAGLAGERRVVLLFGPPPSAPPAISTPGPLVLPTFHTIDASKTIDRIIGTFDSGNEGELIITR
jgi:hypothetical protein